MFRVKHRGSFNKTEQFFNRVLKKDYLNILAKYGELGVSILRSVTPTQTGKTADSWEFGVEEGKGTVTLYWTNTHENDGVNVALMIIYGHGLHNGGYVLGNDFVTPAIQPLMNDLADQVWKEVTQ